MVIAVWTDRRQARRPLVEVVIAAVEGGTRLVVLRERDLPDAERAVLARRLHAVLAPVGGRLLLAGPVPGPDGVHLAAADPLPAPPRGLIGRSCHGAADLDRAYAEGVHYATVSPVFPSASKPGYGPALGVRGLARLCAGTGLAVLALGGVDSPRRVRDCVTAGAAGVAVMGAVMRAEDPARFVADLIEAADRAGVR